MLLALVLAGALAGCGGSGGTSKGDGAEPSASATPLAAEEEAETKKLAGRSEGA